MCILVKVELERAGERERAESERWENNRDGSNTGCANRWY